MRKIVSALILAALCLSLAAPAWARVYIDVTKPFSRRLPLALAPFQPAPGTPTDEAGPQGTRLLGDNLQYTGLFDLLDPKSFLGPFNPEAVNYAKWKRVGAELLVACSYEASGQSLTVECRLLDVVAGKLLTGRRYDGTRADLPVMMQRFADEIMLAITGQRSVFSTAIAFVGARQGTDKVVKELYLMNFDGTGVRRLTNHGDITLYPNWSSDGRLIAYSSYKNRRPAIYMQAMDGGSGRIVFNKPGVNLTPAFVPGSTNLAVSTSHTGKTNIFLIDIAGQILKKLTDGWGIEVHPSFSPDGRQMAFVSDRGGSPQIYIRDMNTGTIRRLTFGMKYCAAPDWSPRGDRIAFQGQNNGAFQICTIRPDGSDLQVLTKGWGGGEDPSWSPDGRLIAYSSRGTGHYQIYVMTSDGQPIRRLTSLAGENTDPAWSPRGVAGPKE